MINYKRKKKVKDTEILKFEGITFTVSRRKVKYSRIEFKAAGTILIIPRNTNPLVVLHDNKKSILKKCAKIKTQVEAAKELALTNRNDEELNELILLYVKKYSGILKVKHEGIKIRKMKRRWGSCRSTGIITLNSYLRFVPEKLLAYIVFHELVHLDIRGHNRQFKAVIAKHFPNYRKMDKELTLYGFRLLS